MGGALLELDAGCRKISDSCISCNQKYHKELAGIPVLSPGLFPPEGEGLTLRAGNVPPVLGVLVELGHAAINTSSEEGDQRSPPQGGPSL